MPDMDGWDWALLAGAVYLAVIALVRLMRSRRDVVLQELSHEAEQQKNRKRQEEKRKSRRKQPQ